MQSILSKYHILLTVLIVSMLYACGVKKYIPEDELLFRGGKVTIIDTSGNEDIGGLESELQSLLYPEPNNKILGLYPGLVYHYKAQKEDTNFIVRFINKKIGEEPSYFSDVNIEKTQELLENRLKNSGFFNTEISTSIEKDSSSKTAETNYTVIIGKAYSLADYSIVIDSLSKNDSVPVYIELERSLSETIIKKGIRYDLDAFKAERERIDQYLKDKGYYNFNSTFILFQADTNLNANKTFNLYLTLKEGVPFKSKVPYVINQVKVFPDATDTFSINSDATSINGIVFQQSYEYFKPFRLRPFILIEPGERYNPLKSKYTSQRISSIGNYKFVNINYQELDSLDSDSTYLRHLNANISLSPLNKRSLRAELQGVTKSNDFTGPELSLTFINRNIFKGGESFSARGNIGYEKQFGRNTSGSSSLRMGLNASLIYPRLIFPGNLDIYFTYAIPKTRISTGYDFMRRTELYTINSYSASFGYIWNANKWVTHEIDPIKINYVRIGNRSAQFDSILDGNPFLKRSFEQQFIAGLNYTFTYNELNNPNRKGRLYARFNFDLAGNAVSMFGKTREGDSSEVFLGLPYAQYIKGDIDLSYHYKITKSGHTLVGRLFGGAGYAYGNSKSMPYVKQYFSGGSYSVRAFQIRGLGPGVYNPDNNEDNYLDRSGDVRLEGNFEYRFPLISVLKGAVFFDAGNVWNLNNSLEGGAFTSDFYKQLGIGTGFGLRVDVSGFVIRFDFAAPLKTPEADWDFDYENPVFNFAIGYPF
ncbi:translocation and assembly module lipoprotein TamL [Brumimicrobium mesophilum]|uniref:translocation and assembly module lipoprotein TamL n=1 Tax=Brumimicrobium mesophilum TaxID=392717 RepID=UPI000D13FB48|nr:BamA/TamA family outer membrane protein [Brumimicrobium mesophilum]